MISSKETAVTDAIAATDKHLAEVTAKLESFLLADLAEGETEADRGIAARQVMVEKKALSESRKVFEELLSVIQTAAANAQTARGVKVYFGSHNQGQQIGVNSGTINFTFGGK